MGGESERRSKKRNSGSSRKRRSKDDSYTSSDYSTSDTEEERRSRKKKRSRTDKKFNKSRKVARLEDSSDEDSDYERRRDRKRRKKRKRERHERKESKNDRKKRQLESSSDGGSGFSSSAGMDGEDRNANTPQLIVEDILKKFPSSKQDLRQLLKMMDDGQAVDIQGISSKSLLKILKKLFQSLNLKKTGRGIYLLPKGASRCLEAVGSIIECDSSLAPDSHSKSQEEYPQNEQSDLLEREGKDNDGNDANQVEVPEPKADSPLPTKRRVIGPAMPSAEMLAAAAKLTEAEAALREAEKDLENDILIGPPPPAVVAEAESANDAERFEEVTRIIALDVSSPYEVLGLNRTSSAESIKKRYWKLSLLVHPDKCSHPEAHQAFTILNQAFKDLKDTTKRTVIDEKIIQREEKEEFEADLKARREAAQWRRLRGEAISGDDELLGEANIASKRDEWMTTVPPERKPGVTMHSTFFSKSEKSERGDTSIWTDTPLEKAEKAKMHYLEAYKQAALTVGDNEIDSLEKKRSSATAELMDNYNKSKRSTSLVEKHQEQKKVSKKVIQSKKQKEEEWSGKHPWKPWDRDSDLAAGRQQVKFDANSSAEGLSSRFSSGNVERSFL